MSRDTAGLYDDGMTKDEAGRDGGRVRAAKVNVGPGESVVTLTEDECDVIIDAINFAIDEDDELTADDVDAYRGVQKKMKKRAKRARHDLRMRDMRDMHNETTETKDG